MAKKRNKERKNGGRDFRKGALPSSQLQMFAAGVEQQRWCALWRSGEPRASVFIPVLASVSCLSCALALCAFQSQLASVWLPMWSHLCTSPTPYRNLNVTQQQGGATWSFASSLHEHTPPHLSPKKPELSRGRSEFCEPDTRKVGDPSGKKVKFKLSCRT